jgi:ribonuclease D
VGLEPVRVFDTELAGRLLGYPRVGLASMVEAVLGYRLEKGHSAADWSERPLPEPWLRYAVLDVEVLLELRDALEAQLRERGKLQWAHEEFAAIVSAPPTPRRNDPWRRVSGLHRVRRPRQLAAVRALWQTRDELARERDLAPGRVLPDSAIVQAALTMPTTLDALTKLAGYNGRATRRQARTWFQALQAARALPERELPPANVPGNILPPTRSWPDRDPEAAERLAVLRAAVAAIADEHTLPTENLLAPDSVRRIAWQPPADQSPEGIAATLRTFGARPWQVSLTAPVIAHALRRLRTRREARGSATGAAGTAP